MADTCGKCEKAFTESDVSAKCTECRLPFHAKCTRVGSSQSFTKSKNKSLKCDSCADEQKSNSSVRSNETEEDKGSILEAIRQLKVDINKNIDEKINKVLSSVNALQGEIKSLKQVVSKLESDHDKLSARCGKLEQDKEELTGVVRDLQQRLNDSEQHSRSSNIEVVGLPVTPNENIYDCLQHIADALNIQYNPEDISVAHRLRVFSRKRHTHPPIIVQFVARRTVDSWIKAARDKKHLQASDIHPSLPRSAVYINHHLTPNNKALLGMARRLRRENKLVFAGFNNGKVLIKTTEGAESVRVSALSDLEKYDRLKPPHQQQ